MKMVTIRDCSVSCQNNNNNNNKNKIENNSNSSHTHNHKHKHEYNETSQYYFHRKLFHLRLTLAIWFGLILSVAVESAAVYSNVDFLANPQFEPICSAQQEHFIEADGKESSLILEFNRVLNADKRKSCTRILSAPANYGFIVRLILPKIRRAHGGGAAVAVGSDSNAGGKSKLPADTSSFKMTALIEKLNATALRRTCPVSIFSSLDPHTPQWRIDPCQLEDTAPEMEDPVRLFHGRVRVVWENRHNKVNSKLMVTVLGKGEQCHSDQKHPCLQIGDEPILCISKELVCDGIRHCPYSNEYNSDEDYDMCWKRRRFGEPIPPAMESDLFEHFALEVFRNLFASDVPEVTEENPANEPANNPVAGGGANSTTLRKVDVLSEAGKEKNSTDSLTTSSPPLLDNTTESLSIGGHHRRNSTRFGLNSDLSKYGPWGYLMLGMLLCGGALLICGLWASASQHAANNEREAALQSGASGVGGGAGGGIENMSGTNGPPNYDELDPPPAYSVLFPNQKAASSSTLSSLAAPIAVQVTSATTTTSDDTGTACANGNAASTSTGPPSTTTQPDTQSQEGDVLASGSSRLTTRQ